jgi:RNA polymerase sigma-70 factor (ECF subfamily)
MARAIDLEVLDACRAGDRAAFRRVFVAYKDRVYSTALYFTGEAGLAHDITQIVFLKVLTRMEQFHATADFSTWLYRIAVNACLDQHRKKGRFLRFLRRPALLDQRPDESIEERYGREEVSLAVRRAIATLPPKLRIPMLLRHVEGLSYDEIARVVGCRRGTVGSRLSRAQRLLARKLAHLESEVER